MIILNDIELHDAKIKGMRIDYENSLVVIDIEHYRSTSDSSRSSARITFEGVGCMTQVFDQSSIIKNAFAGNINYWVPNPDGTTFIYLADGCISIRASKLSHEYI